MKAPRPMILATEVGPTLRLLQAQEKIPHLVSLGINCIGLSLSPHARETTLDASLFFNCISWGFGGLGIRVAVF